MNATRVGTTRVLPPGRAVCQRCGIERSTHAGPARPLCRDCRDLARYEAASKPSDNCGTPAGYSRHRKRHEPVCEPCREANRRRLANRRARAA